MRFQTVVSRRFIRAQVLPSTCNLTATSCCFVPKAGAVCVAACDVAGGLGNLSCSIMLRTGMRQVAGSTGFWLLMCLVRFSASSHFFCRRSCGTGTGCGHFSYSWMGRGRPLFQTTGYINHRCKPISTNNPQEHLSGRLMTLIQVGGDK